MNKDVEKIRAEIERRYNYHKDHADDWAGTCNFWSAHEDREILSFIDSMQEEPVGEEWIKELRAKLDSLSKEDFEKVFDKYAIDFNEEPVSEDLESEIQHYNNSLNLDAEENYEWDDIASNVILAARHFAKWQKAKDESTTEDLGDYINELSKQFPEVSFAKLSRIAVRVAKWQKAKVQETIETAIHHAYHNGKLEMKEQMIATAVDGTARPDDNEIWCNLASNNLKDGDKVKVIVIKEE